MGVLEITGFVLLYLLVGFALGKITYHEYENQTPTEALGRFGKFKRLLLFPKTYHDWGDKSFFNGNEGPPASAVAMLEENSYQISMFLWPLKLIPTVAGIASMLFFSIIAIVKGVSTVLDNAFQILLKAPRVPKRALEIARILPVSPTSLDLSEQIRKTRKFLEEIGKKEMDLFNKKMGATASIAHLENVLREWQELPKKPDRMAENIIKGLSEEISSSKSKLEELDRTRDALIERERELKNLLRTFEMCKKTMELGVHITTSGGGLVKKDSIAILGAASASSSALLIAECKGLLKGKTD